MKIEKPIEECIVSPGKLLSAFPGFVQMWNWIQQTVFNFTFGPGLALHEDELGHKMAYLNVEWGDGFEVETNEESGRVFVSLSGGGGGEGEGNVTVTGTEGTATGSNIIFRTADDSNIKINVAQANGGTIVVTLGAYYK